ncbi:hypothetical protein ACMZ6Y_04625 [Streptococcus pluranimalium]
MKKAFIMTGILLSSTLLLAACYNKEAKAPQKSPKTETTSSTKDKTKDTEQSTTKLEEDFIGGKKPIKSLPSSPSRNNYEIVLSDDGEFSYYRGLTIKNPNVSTTNNDNSDFPYVIDSLKDISVEASESPVIYTTLLFKGNWEIKDGKINVSDLKLDGEELPNVPDPEDYTINELKDKMSAEDFEVLTATPQLTGGYLIPSTIEDKAKDRHDTSSSDNILLTTIDDVKEYSVPITEKNVKKIQENHQTWTHNLIFVDQQYSDIYQRFYANKDDSKGWLEENPDLNNPLYLDPSILVVSAFGQ